MSDKLQVLEDADTLVHWKKMKIVAAAVLFEGKIYTMPQPARHWNIVHAMSEMGIAQDHRSEQGFLTDSGDFVRRKPAFMIAEYAHQLLKQPVCKDGLLVTRDLFSEDLW